LAMMSHEMHVLVPEFPENSLLKSSISRLDAAHIKASLAFG